MTKRLILPVLLFLVVFSTFFAFNNNLNYDGFMTAAAYVSTNADTVVNDFEAIGLYSEALKIFDANEAQFYAIYNYDSGTRSNWPIDIPMPDWMSSNYTYVFFDGELIGSFLNRRVVSEDTPGAIPVSDLNGNIVYYEFYDLTTLIEPITQLSHDAPEGALTGLEWLANWFKVFPLLFNWLVGFSYDILSLVFSFVRAGLHLVGLG